MPLRTGHTQNTTALSSSSHRMRSSAVTSGSATFISTSRALPMKLFMLSNTLSSSGITERWAGRRTSDKRGTVTGVSCRPCPSRFMSLATVTILQPSPAFPASTMFRRSLRSSSSLAWTTSMIRDCALSVSEQDAAKSANASSLYPSAAATRVV